MVRALPKNLDLYNSLRLRAVGEGNARVVWAAWAAVRAGRVWVRTRRGVRVCALQGRDHAGGSCDMVGLRTGTGCSRARVVRLCCLAQAFANGKKILGLRHVAEWLKAAQNAYVQLK